MVIAIDGPAGAGKSTVSRQLARELGFIYLDTGAMYRAVAWALRREDLRHGEPSLTLDALSQLPLQFQMVGGELVVVYRGKRLGDELRDPEITNMASRISQNPVIREFLTGQQRRLASEGDVVAEGRDMTTVVFPDSPIKVFLTADLATRAQRRQIEYRQKGLEIEYELLEAQIRARDEADQQRSVAPLRPSADAFLLDTSQLDASEVLAQLVDFYNRKNMGREPNGQNTAIGSKIAL
ncbi:MAG TPA: (d)CMP kinase [Syntrophobacteraceae bacterium]|nr:(d)CMP kinase [Syntrophobacteraceae bacterium]